MGAVVLTEDVSWHCRFYQYLLNILLEWTQLVCTTSFYQVICEDLTPVSTDNYVPLLCLTSDVIRTIVVWHNGVARIFFGGGPIFRDLRRPTRFGGGG